MKKYLLLIAFLPIFCFAQNATVIIQNNSNGSSTTQTRTDNGYYIQGISSAENIGGVDATTTSLRDPYAPGLKYVDFKNYRNFPVTVLIEFTYGHPDYSVYLYEGSITLDAKETKRIGSYNLPRNFKMIVRALN